MCRECFPRHRLRRKPLVSDSGMHHGTCIMHVPWCMSGSLTRGGRKTVPGIPGACATCNLRIWQEAHESMCRVHYGCCWSSLMMRNTSVEHTSSWGAFLQPNRIFVFWLKSYWSLFLRVQLPVSQHLFMQWLGTVQVTSHYLDKWWPSSLTFICTIRLQAYTPGTCVTNTKRLLAESLADAKTSANHSQAFC